MKARGIGAAVLVLVGAACSSGSGGDGGDGEGCSADQDCKGDRICVLSECVTPGSASGGSGPGAGGGAGAGGAGGGAGGGGGSSAGGVGGGAGSSAGGVGGGAGSSAGGVGGGAGSSAGGTGGMGPPPQYCTFTRSSRLACPGLPNNTDTTSRCVDGVDDLADCRSRYQSDTSCSGGCCTSTTISGHEVHDGTCASPLCGNDVIDGSEECDNENFNGADCESATSGSLLDGILLCSSDCKFVTSNCNTGGTAGVGGVAGGGGMAGVGGISGTGGTGGGTGGTGGGTGGTGGGTGGTGGTGGGTGGTGGGTAFQCGDFGDAACGSCVQTSCCSLISDCPACLTWLECSEQCSDFTCLSACGAMPSEVGPFQSCACFNTCTEQCTTPILCQAG